MRRLCLLTLLLAGCSPSDQDLVDVVWLEGAGFGWMLFNHRLSHLELRLDDDRIDAAVIGGTSTTGVVTRLEDECERQTCSEFPFLDESDVHVRWARAQAPAITVGVATASLLIGPDGATGEVVVDLPEPAYDNTVAVIRGLLLDTDQPLEGGESCYRPKNGWLPRRIQVALGAPEVQGDRVVVPVSGAFEAGNTMEHERQCLDAVVTRARVRLQVDVQVVSGEGLARTHPVSQQIVYDWNGSRATPDPQEPPPPVALGIDPEALAGFSALDFTFHDDDPELRGAYVRTLAFDLIDGGARGAATNYSPGTQLSGFDYTFTGTVSELHLGVAPSRGEAFARIPTTLDEDGRPVVHELALDGAR